VEEAALLMAVQRIVGGVEVEDDPSRRPLMRKRPLDPTFIANR
jgi:hypothetical protein